MHSRLPPSCCMLLDSSEIPFRFGLRYRCLHPCKPSPYQPVSSLSSFSFNLPEACSLLGGGTDILALANNSGLHISNRMYINNKYANSRDD